MRLPGYDPTKGQTMKTDVPHKVVDRAFLAHFKVLEADAVAASNDGVLAATALAADAQQITENITSPAVPRNIMIKGNQAGVAGDVVIHGTNYADEEIEETIVLNADQVVAGSKAFKTVTQIDLPVEVNAGADTVSVGWGDKLGLPYKLTHNTVIDAFHDKALEGNAPTVTVDADEIEKNTIDLNTALNGKQVDAYLIV